MDRILIVDDNPDNLDLLREQLEGYGYAVDQSGDGAAALAQAFQTPPLLIISDLLMPVMDGFTLLRQWKADARLRPIPFIIYTATYTDAKDERLAMDLGADAYITKVAGREILMERLHEVLEKGKKGNAPLAQAPQLEEHVILKQYNEVLVRKLETKAFELEQANAALRDEITEHKQAEERRRASDARYRTLFDYAPDGIVIADPEGYYIDANAGICRMLGYSSHELIGLHSADVVAPSELPHIGPALSAIKAKSNHHREWQFLRKDGSLFEAEVMATLMPDGNLLGMIRDITKRKEADSRIQCLNRVYAVLSGINETIVREKNLQRMLEAACHIAIEQGLLRMAWIGLVNTADRWLNIAAHAGAAEDTLQLLRDCLGKEESQCQCAFTLHALQTGEHGVCHTIAGDPLAQEWRDACLQRGYRAMASLPLRVDKKIIGTFNLYSDTPGFFDADEMRLLDELAMDIGFALEVHHREFEHQRLEEQLRQAQKMEAFGQLAGGVAHDFNNMLTVILGCSEILLRQASPEDDKRDLLEEIHKAGERSALLTRQLLTFSRKQAQAPKVLGLNGLVSNTEKMLRRLIGEDIELTVLLSAQLDCVKADPGQLEQVLLNLSVNARDAMPKGGKLTIETHLVELDDTYAELHLDVDPGRYVLLAVTDSGGGMSDETKLHLFEPFFTTKEPGKGTGLGLSVVHGIVKQSGGVIQVYSEPGLGTSFKIYLPCAECSGVEVELRTPPGPAPHGTETLFLIEDESSVRVLTHHMLQHLGYTVLEASCGEDALRLATQHHSAIQLLITDVVMPGLGGRELAEQLLIPHPEMKVLYLSGYTDDTIVRHGILHDQVNFLQKPFTQSTLAHKVRAALAK